jgi:maleylpyruvate isomerase
MIFYDYFRSSAAYRVRLALELKGLKLARHCVHLANGDQHQAEYLSKNPQGLVPAIELDNGALITQSLAIIEYLDRLYPTPRLVPEDPLLAAKARAVAYVIACDTHPLINLRVGAYLLDQLGESPSHVEKWRRHWILKGGLEAVEQMIDPRPFCFGAHPTLADICLIPQIFSARRFAAPLEHLPKIVSVDAACASLSAFRAAHPSAQPDAE